MIFYLFMYFLTDISGDKEYQNIENIVRTRERDVTLLTCNIYVHVCLSACVQIYIFINFSIPFTMGK